MLFRKKNNIVNYDENIIYSPVSGRVIKLEEVNDPVFSKKMMGSGVGIYPNDNHIYSPVSGTVKMIFPTKHAIGIEGKNGKNVILHCGIETVNLKGKYFDVKCEVGKEIKAGDLILEMNVAQISKTCDPTIMLIIENSDDSQIEFIASGNVEFKQPLIKMQEK